MDTAQPLEILQGLTEDLRKETKKGAFGKWDKDVPVLLNKAYDLTAHIRAMRAEEGCRRVLDEDIGDGRPNRHIYLRACSWTAEILGYFDKTAEARDLVETEGQFILSHLPESRPLAYERRLHRQGIWVILHHSYYSLYLQHDIDGARRVVDGCDRFVATFLQSEDFPCYYTRARIAMHQAAIHRQLGQLRTAQESYEKALSLIHQRLEFTRTEEDAEEYRNESTRANYEAAKILALGIGWTQSTRGLLKEARVNVVTALVMLSPINDVLRKAYAKLLLASIDRAEAGFDPTKLDAAMTMLDGPYKIFRDYRHGRYESRCRYEQALANLYRGKAEEDTGTPDQRDRYYAAAETHIRAVLDFSTAASDSRWECISYTVLSRIKRYMGDINEAGSHAARALSLASNERGGSVALDAHLAQGEAHFEADNSAEAIRHFEAALKLAEKNPKSLGFCNLRLAEAYLKTRNLRKALEHYHHWESIEHEVAHGVVKGIAVKIKQQLDAAQKAWYVIPGDQALNYKKHDRSLREFLIARAAARQETVDAIAAELGITRGTYYNWLKELNEPEP